MEIDNEKRNSKRKFQATIKCPNMMNNYDPYSYIKLLSENRNYQIYLLATFCQHLGHWFSRIGSLLTIERLSPGSSSALAAMVMVHTLPHIVWTPLGGILADSYDRKKCMIVLDMISGVAVLGYLVAIRSENVEILFSVTIVRASLHALYEPVTRAIVPMLVEEEEDLKRVVTMNGVMWSSMLALGGFIMGPVSALVGLEACFIIDSVTYFISSCITKGLDGSFSVSHKRDAKITTTLSQDSSNHHSNNTSYNNYNNYNNNNNNNNNNYSNCMKYINYIQYINKCCCYLTYPFRSLYNMSKEVLQYLSMCGFGLLVLLQPCASAVWGSSDVLNTSYAHVDNDEADTSRRLGLLSSSVGLGCLIGPLLTNSLLDVDPPRKLQALCVWAFAWMALGWWGLSLVDEDDFFYVCFYTFVRNIGSGVLWIDSTLLLQVRHSYPIIIHGLILFLDKFINQSINQ